MNWKDEVADKLRKYPAMVSATKLIPQELKSLDQEARAIQSMQPGRSGGRNLRANENKLMNIMMKRQELEMLLHNAECWVAITEDAMNQLTEQEKKLLTLLYIEDNGPQYACTQLALERSSLYRHRDEALKKLTLAMYGALES